MRLIDADALIAEIVKTTSFVKDSMLFQKMVDEAPTVSAEAAQRWIPFTRRPMTEEEQKDYPNCTFKAIEESEVEE